MTDTDLINPPAAPAPTVADLTKAVARLSSLYADVLSRLNIAELKLAMFKENGEKLTWRLCVLEAQSMPSNPSRYQMGVMVRKRLEALNMPESNALMLSIMDEAVRKGDRELLAAFSEPIPGMADQEMVDDMIFQRLLEMYPPGMPGTREHWSREENIALAKRVNAKRRELMAQGVATLPPMEEVDLRMPPTERALRNMTMADAVRMALPQIEEASRGESTGQ